MTIDAAVRTYLLTITGLTALIVDRIYPATAEPGLSIYPYVLYSEINSIEGTTNEAEGYDKYYQFTIYSKDYDQCQAIKELIKSAFYHKPNANYTDIYIKTANFNGSHDFSYDALNECYSASIDIIVSYVKLI
jgi:hypothetical protein